MKNELTFARSAYSQKAYRLVGHSIRRPANRQTFSIRCPATTYVRRLLGTDPPPVRCITHVQAIRRPDLAARAARFRPGRPGSPTPSNREFLLLAEKGHVDETTGPPSVTADHPRVVKFKELVEADELTSDEICESLEISKATYYRYLEL